jgi:hypothetical protein
MLLGLPLKMLQPLLVLSQLRIIIRAAGLHFGQFSRIRLVSARPTLSVVTGLVDMRLGETQQDTTDSVARPDIPSVKDSAHVLFRLPWQRRHNR